MTQTLAGRTILMSGGSRGIGLAIALRAARDGANVAILAKTDTPHPKLEGTIHTAAAEIEAAGGAALPILGDVRSQESVEEAVAQTVERFGGIDIVVNNASAIDLSPTEQLSMKKYDLMQDINTRGSFLLAKSALPHLRSSDRAHVLTLSPPINLAPHWAGRHLGYTIAKYGMSLVTSVWPRNGASWGSQPTACGPAPRSPRPQCRTSSAATRPLPAVGPPRSWPTRRTPSSCASRASAPAASSSMTRYSPRRASPTSPRTAAPPTSCCSTSSSTPDHASVLQPAANSDQG